LQPNKVTKLLVNIKSDRQPNLYLSYQPSQQDYAIIIATSEIFNLCCHMQGHCNGLARTAIAILFGWGRTLTMGGSFVSQAAFISKTANLDR
jgi:hypothetical protein